MITIGEALRGARRTLVGAVAVAASLAAPLAPAAYIGTLAFTEPTGTVGPTDPIPVWIRVTLDPASDPLSLNNDGGATPPFGVPPENYPLSGTSNELNNEGIFNYELASIDALDSVILNTSFTCSGTFTVSCSPGAYSFSFNTSGPDTINFVPIYNGGPTFDLQPGATYDYLFGTFTPTGGGPVAPGSYYFYGSSLFLQFAGTASWRINATDEYGNPLYDEDTGDPIFLPDLRSASFNADLYIAQTPCGYNSDPSCEGAFVREVSAVPAPAALWLFGTAAGAVALRARRRAPH